MHVLGWMGARRPTKGREPCLAKNSGKLGLQGSHNTLMVNSSANPPSRWRGELGCAGVTGSVAMRASYRHSWPMRPPIDVPPEEIIFQSSPERELTGPR